MTPTEREQLREQIEALPSRVCLDQAPRYMEVLVKLDDVLALLGAEEDGYSGYGLTQIPHHDVTFIQTEGGGTVYRDPPEEEE